MDDQLIDAYLKALLAGDRQQCRHIVTEILATDADIKEIYTRLFQLSLYRVGELWETNKISVATEHMATAITDGLLTLVYPKIFAAEHIGKKAIIACTANEYHQIGGKMVADIFELNGWDGHFLGANTPLEDLLAFVDEKKPDVMGLSLSIYSNLPLMLKTIEAVRTHFADLDLFVGGQAFRWGGIDTIRQFPRTQYIPTLHDLEKEIIG